MSDFAPGLHLLIDHHGGRHLTDPVALETALRGAADAAGATVLAAHFHHFRPEPADQSDPDFRQMGGQGMGPKGRQTGGQTGGANGPPVGAQTGVSDTVHTGVMPPEKDVEGIVVNTPEKDTDRSPDKAPDQTPDKAGDGVTGVLLLAESHISIHTWPEIGYAAIDIFVCGQGRAQAAADYLARALLPDWSKVTAVQRNHLSQPAL